MNRKQPAKAQSLGGLFCQNKGINTIKFFIFVYNYDRILFCSKTGCWQGIHFKP